MWYMNEERELLQKAFREYAQKRVRPYVDKMEQEAAREVYSIIAPRLGLA